MLKLHASLIKAIGGSKGIRDEGMLDMALNNPFQSFDGKELYPSILALDYGTSTIDLRRIQIIFMRWGFCFYEYKKLSEK